jgi:hypothetical protein
VLYEVNESYRVEVAPDILDPVASAYNRVAVREVTETMLSSFYELERAAFARYSIEEARGFIAWWIQELRQAATVLGSMNFDVWRSQI